MSGLKVKLQKVADNQSCLLKMEAMTEPAVMDPEFSLSTFYGVNLPIAKIEDFDALDLKLAQNPVLRLNVVSIKTRWILTPK